MRILSIRGLAIAAAAVAMLATVQANAALLSVDDPHFGVGSITRDTVSGLDWLDVNQSANRSYNQILIQFGAGGDFEGWRYGTPAEVTGLWQATGFPVGHLASPPDPNIIPVIHLLGETVHEISANLINHAVIGILDSSSIMTNVIVSRGQYADIPTSTGQSLVTLQTDIFITRDSVAPTFGHWLVRSTPAISEPPVMAILAIGLAGLGYARRRQGRHPGGESSR